jgi:ribosome-associated toxin RatA of RatAB toxin-antitoxin module
VAVVKKSAQIAAAPEKVLAIMLDVTEHPKWQKEVESIDILEADDQGRPLRTKVNISAMGQNASYSLQYQYPTGTSFAYQLAEGEETTVTTLNNFTFAANPSADGTSIDVTQEIDLKWPLPGFMIDQLALKGVKDMIKNLTAQAESA